MSDIRTEINSYYDLADQVTYQSVIRLPGLRKPRLILLWKSQITDLWVLVNFITNFNVTRTAVHQLLSNRHTRLTALNLHRAVREIATHGKFSPNSHVLTVSDIKRVSLVREFNLWEDEHGHEKK